jgi:hypothetical protein
MPVLGSVLLLYVGAHKISLKYLFPEKMFIEVCCQKCQKCNTICVTTFLKIELSPIPQAYPLNTPCHYRNTDYWVDDTETLTTGWMILKH